ncbi:hypothetical protein DH2020_005640 [Rehmannia glutinosa]|uniref:Aminotransferase-like plant mobile domain-containing protein n=1 Tax=Rehmannia glutinosa TaxID=99300 RepID=A0ABR0XH93_REHGL
MAKNKGKRAAGSGDEGDGRGKRKKNLYTTLSTRSNPRVLVNALGNLSPAQIDAIVDMGFGSLLSLSIVDFPTQLMYWLVANFNPASSELLLDSMRRIRIEPNDVQRVLGFPNGQQPIVKKTKSETCDLYTGWPAMFGREDYKVTPKQVADKMLSFVDGGDWFRRMFLILVEYLIIGNFSSAYVYPHLLKSLVDVRNVRNLAWCEHTLTTLVEKRAAWSPEDNTEFNGPFFDGPHRVGLERGQTKGKEQQGNRPWWVWDGAYRAPFDGEAQTEPLGEFGLEGEGCYSRDLVIPADAKDLVEDAEFAMVGNVAKGFLCSTALPGGVRRSDDGMEGTESQQNEAFWSKAENIAAIEAIESAFLKRDEFKKWCDEAPSFSIGLTQDTNVGRWEDILDTSRHYEKSVNEEGDVRDGGMASVEVGVLEMNVGGAAMQAGIEKPATVEDSEIGGPGGHDAPSSENPKTDVETEVGGVKPVALGRSRRASDIALERSKKVFSRRATRKTKQSAVLSSPFVTRQIDVCSKPNQNENMIAKWLFENPGSNKDDIVFNAGDKLLSREIMETMRPGGYINVSILDLWAWMLNGMEGLRSSSSPNRFFASCFLTLFTIVSPGDGLDENFVYRSFVQGLDTSSVTRNSDKLNNFDMRVSCRDIAKPILLA